MSSASSYRTDRVLSILVDGSRDPRLLLSTERCVREAIPSGDYSDVSQSSPTGDQTEAENGLIARNDASNGVVANLLRDDSAGSAGAASAALGGAA